MTDLSAEQAIVDWLLQDFQTPASKSSPKVALARPTSAQLKPAQASFYFFSPSGHLFSILHVCEPASAKRVASTGFTLQIASMQQQDGMHTTQRTASTLMRSFLRVPRFYYNCTTTGSGSRQTGQHNR
jgi:hypothetical protein